MSTISYTSFDSNKDLLDKHGISKEIVSGCCYIRKGNFNRREVREAISHLVIEGARKLRQRPGKVMPARDGGLELDRRAVKQFSEIYEV